MESFTYHCTSVPPNLLQLAQRDIEARLAVIITITPGEDTTSATFLLQALSKNEIDRAKAYLADHLLYRNYFKETPTAGT